MTDGLGRTTTLSFDDQNNLTEISTPITTTQFLFDDSPNSLLVASIDPAGTRIDYHYDAQGNPSGRTFVDGTSESFSYSDTGLLSEYVNRRSQSVQFTHDSDGHLLTKTYAGADAFSFQYDARGNLIAAQSSEGTIQRQYDALDQLTRIDYPTGQFLEYEYDVLGRRTTIRNHLGNELNSVYDSRGRLIELTDENDVSVVAFAYNDINRVTTKTLQNGVQTSYEYKDSGEISRLTNTDANGTVLSFFEYEYDAAGQVVSTVSDDGTWTYEYDLLGQITRASLDSSNPELSDQEFTYTYDLVGNRTSRSVNGVVTNYASNELHQYEQIGDVSYEYDADGNLLSRTDGSNVTTYEYNHENRLVAVTGEFGSHGVSVRWHRNT